VQILTSVITGTGGGYSEALRLAWRWLRDAGAVHEPADHYAARDELTAARGTLACPACGCTAAPAAASPGHSPGGPPRLGP
jgi:hypothetical protein